MNPKITLVESYLNKEVIASNIMQHDFINKMVDKSLKKPRKDPPLNQTSPFGDFPSTYKTNKVLKENKRGKSKKH